VGLKGYAGAVFCWAWLRRCRPPFLIQNHEGETSLKRLLSVRKIIVLILVLVCIAVISFYRSAPANKVDVTSQLVMLGDVKNPRPQDVAL